MKYVTLKGAYPATVATNLHPQAKTSSPVEQLLARTKMDTPVLAKGTTGTTLYESWITVPEGMSSLVVGVGNWQSGPVDKMYMRLYRPDFTPVSTVTSLANPMEMVLAPHGNPGINDAIAGAVIVNPTPGRWNVQWPDVSPDMPPFELTAGAVPATNGARIMADEVGAILQAGHDGDLKRAVSWSWACAGCKVAAYGLAILISAVAAGAAAATLGMESALVVATAGFASVTAPVALAFIVALCTAATATVDKILSELCSWVGICD